MRSFLLADPGGSYLKPAGKATLWFSYKLASKCFCSCCTVQPDHHVFVVLKRLIFGHGVPSRRRKPAICLLLLCNLDALFFHCFSQRTEQARA